MELALWDYSKRESLRVSHSNIRIGRKLLRVTNTLAYCNTESTVKNFIEQAHGADGTICLQCLNKETF
jgi:hypothetical protein